MSNLFAGILPILLAISYFLIILSLMIAFIGSRKLKIQDIELSVHKKQRFERIRLVFNEHIQSNKNPVMFLRGAVLKDRRTGKNLLQLKFINTSPKEIKSVYTVVNFIDDAGDIIANNTTIQAEYLDINCASKDSFGQKQLLELGDIGAIHLDITYNKVVFVDGTVWRAEQVTESQKPAKVTFLKSMLPPELQDGISEESICKPEVLTDGLWRCTCGCLVRNIDGDSCLNCQQTFEQAQEAVSISVLEKRKQTRIAEQEQKALDEKVSKKQSKEYIKQLVFIILTILCWPNSLFIYAPAMIFKGHADNFLTLLVVVVCVMACCVSLIATAILVHKVRKGGPIKDVSSVRKTVRIQGISALIPCVTCMICLIATVLNVLYLLTHTHPSDWSYDIGSYLPLLLFSTICTIPNFAYCMQLPFARNWLSKHKKSKEITALIICGIAVLVAIGCIAHIPSCMHFYMGGGFEFDSYIVLPCVISVLVAAVLIIYCSRLSMVKGWLAKRKSKKNGINNRKL